jgi:hypothetical protein
MWAKTNRRDFLRFLAYSGAGAGMFTTAFGVERLALPIWQQYECWQAAMDDADTFIDRHRRRLARLHFGANICPDYKLFAAKADPERAVKLIKDYFGCTHVRLGVRWSTHAEHGFSAYDRWIEALLKHGIKTVIGYGVKSPFPPETHFPPLIEANLLALGVTKGSTIYADSPLGRYGLIYSRGLLDHLEREFGLDSFYGFNPENEFDAHFGRHLLSVGEDLLHAQAQLLYNPQRRRRLLLNTAIISPPGQTASLTNVINSALALRATWPTLDPIIGADIYEETGSGHVGANVYVDTFAGVQMRHGDRLIPNARATLAEAEIPLEVTEFQISDWIDEPREVQPGDRIHTQYLILRMLDFLVDDSPTAPPEPFIARLWEMSRVLVMLLEDERSFYQNEMYQLIQRINRLG